MSTSTEDVAGSLGLLAQAVQRGLAAEAVVAVLRQQGGAPAQAFDALSQSLRDVPQLAELAKRNLLDRALIQQHAGHQQRAERVRDLHMCLELPGGRLICRHCRVEFPCPTTVALDG